MQKEQLERTFAWFRARPGRIAALKCANAVCTGAAYAAFCAEVAVRLARRDGVVLQMVVTCGVSFVLLSLVRALLDRPRPYEVYGLPPLLPKDTRGKSFPSRHVFSICVIGTSLLYLTPWLGVVLLALGAVLAVCRVVSGVHFERDVLVGAALGILSGMIGFSI